jgi:preprotein translocase subunit SecE
MAYIAFAILAAVVLARGIHAGLFYAGIEDYPLLGSEFTASTAAGVVLAIIAFAATFRNPEVRPLADQVASELAKVVWPTRQETWSATIVVIVTVIISAVYLGLFDAVWQWASNAILSIPNGATHG